MDAAGTLLRGISLEAVSTKAWLRLLKACVLSLLLHIALLFGIPVIPGGVAPQAPAAFTARLESVFMESVPATDYVTSNAEPAERARSAEIPQKSSASKLETKPRPRAQEPASEGGLEVPFARDPTYYPAKQLDVYPRPVTQIRLDYPASAVVAKVDGRLMVLLLIDEFGAVNDASVVESRPEGFFEEATLEVLRAARFTPAEKQGRPVKSRVLLQINYSYGNSAATLY
jgi:protein TonB